MKKTLRYFLTCCLAVLASASFAQTTITFTAGEDVGSKTANKAPDEISKDGVTISCTDAAFAAVNAGSGAGEYRFYKGSTTTITSTAGNITKIVFTCTASGAAKQGPGCLENFEPGTYTYEGKVGTWTGSAASITCSSPTNQVRATKIEVTIGGTPAETVSAPVISGDATFKTSTTVTITGEEGADIYYTTDGNDPTTASTKYAVPFDLTETTTVKAIAVKGSLTSTVASATFTKSNLQGEGTEANPYTVADALSVLSAGTQTKDSVCVKGIIKNVKSYSSKFSNINFSIVDAPADADTLYAYAINNVGNTKFSAATDLMEGDTVVVYGPLSEYKGTKEIGKGYLKYLGRSAAAVAAPAITGDAAFTTSTTVTITGEEGAKVYYTTDGTDPTAASTEYTAPFELTATTTVKAIAYKGSNASEVASKTFMKMSHAGTESDPFTVDDVITLQEANALPTDTVCVTGLVNIAASDTANVGMYGNIGFSLSDDTGDNSIKIFRAKDFSNKKFTAETANAVMEANGKSATVKGLLQVYNSALELSYGYLVELNGVTTGINSVKVANSLTEGVRYNLAGQRVDKNYKGVVIVNGRKIIVK